MADVNIGAKISVDTGSTTKSISEMQGEIKKLSTEMKNAKLGSEEYEKASLKLKEAQSALANSTKEKTSSFGLLKEQLKGTVPVVDSVSNSVVGFGKQLWALAANPIVLILVAIVGALKFLYEAFTYTVEGGKKMKQIMAGIEAVIKVLVDRVMTFGGAIIKFFSGDLKGAFNDAKEAISGVGDEVSRVFKRTAELTKQLQGIRKEERQDELERAERGKRLALLREKLNDESVPLAERKAAAKELREDQDKNAREDLARAKRKADIQIELFKQEKDGARKHAEEINEINIKVLETEKENALEAVRTNRVVRNLDKQEKSEAKAAAQKAAEEQKNIKENLVEYQNKLLKLQQEQQLASIKDAYEKEKQIILNRIADEKRQNDVALQTKKLTKQEFNRLNLELDKVGAQQLDELRRKHEKEEHQKEVEFQKELAAIKSSALLASIDDLRIKERMALDESYKAKKDQALANEKLNDQQISAILLALAEEHQALKTAQQKKFDDEDKAKNLKGQKDLLKAEYDLKVAQYGHKLDADLEYFDKTRELERLDLVAKKATMDELTAFDIETTAQRIAMGEQEAKAKKEAFGAIGNAMSALGELIGKETIAGKALGIAQATINTWLGVTEVLRAKSVLPEPLATISKIASITATVAAGLNAVRNIAGTNVAGSGGSGGGVGAAASAPLAPSVQVSTTQLDQKTINSIGNAAVKSYVLEADVNSNQERIRRINRAARLG